MTDAQLLESFKILFKTCGLKAFLEIAVAHKGVADIAPEQFISSLAHDCVDLVRATRHPLFTRCDEVIAAKNSRYESSEDALMKDLPYGASSILTEVWRKVKILVLQDKQGRLTSLEGNDEDIADAVNWLRFLWSYLEGNNATEEIFKVGVLDTVAESSRKIMQKAEDLRSGKFV